MLSTQTHLQVSVSDDLIKKSPRLFNGTLTDRLIELLQNGRRAGATEIHIDVASGPGNKIHIAVRDNGHGVSDPQKLITLGASGWDNATLRREDPAGMGMFSLAGTDADITSHAEGHLPFTMMISIEAWSANAIIPIAYHDHPDRVPIGTSITFTVDATTSIAQIKTDVEKIARFYPLPVFFNDEKLDTRDWLSDCTYVEEVMGLRIGVTTASRGFRADNINFHGLQVHYKGIPTIQELRYPSEGASHGAQKSWNAYVDIVDCPELQLVLPARKEVVETEFLASLQEYCRKAIYRAIQREGGKHALPYANWQEARSFGIHLPEAINALTSWIPKTSDAHADVQYCRATTRPETGKPIIIACDSADVETSIARALDVTPGWNGLHPYDSEPRMKGYSWYDAIPTVTHAIREASINGTVTFDDNPIVDLIGKMEKPVFDELHIDLKLENGDTLPGGRLRTDFIVIDDGQTYCAEEAAFAVTKDADLPIETMTDLITDALFSASDDSDCDSPSTQLKYWREETQAHVIQTLRSGHEADIEAIRLAFLDRVRYQVPFGQSVNITFNRKHEKLDIILVKVDEDEHVSASH